MRRPLLVRRVVGKSMEPGLKEGQVIYASALRRVKPGRLAVVKLDDKEVIKRIESIDRDFCDLVSDSPKGTEYKHIAVGRIIGISL